MTTLRPELLDELLAEYERPEDLLGEEGLFRQLKKALLERALGAELSECQSAWERDPGAARNRDPFAVGLEAHRPWQRGAEGGALAGPMLAFS